MEATDQFRLDFEWQDPGAAKGEELRATWGSICIHLGEACITELQDRRSRSVRRQLYLPLYPLAEWIACNWWFLTTETECRSVNDREFERRHNLRWAREGFALPSLSIVSLGDSAELRWDQSEVPDSGIKFLSRGCVRLPGFKVAEVLREFVDAVVARLLDSGIQDTLLQSEWQAITTSDEAEIAYCRAAAQLGVDPYATSPLVERELLAAASSVRPELLHELLALSSATSLTADTTRLRLATAIIADDTSMTDALVRLRGVLSAVCGAGTAWERGYGYAAIARSALGGENWKSTTIEELADRLQIDQLEHLLLPAADACGVFDAILGVNSCGNPRWLLQKKSDASRQFTFCRAIFEYLTGCDGRFSTVSKLRTDRQQMSRAFAAEFLAPHEMLRSDLSGAWVTEEEIDDLASVYGVSSFVIRHQIENHSLANVA